MNGEEYKRLFQWWRNWWARTIPGLGPSELDRRARQQALFYQPRPQPTPVTSFRDAPWYQQMPPELQAQYGDDRGGRPPGMASPPRGVPPPSYWWKKREEALPPEGRGKQPPPRLSDEEWKRQMKEGVTGLMMSPVSFPGRTGDSVWRFLKRVYHLQEAGRPVPAGVGAVAKALVEEATRRMPKTPTELDWVNWAKDYLQKAEEPSGGAG